MLLDEIASAKVCRSLQFAWQKRSCERWFKAHWSEGPGIGDGLGAPCFKAFLRIGQVGIVLGLTI